MIDTDTTPSVAPADEPIASPEWKREPPRVAADTASTVYRGLRLAVDTYGWTVAGRFAGYSAVAVSKSYADLRPSIEDHMAAAVAAADDLLAQGWTA